MFYAFVAVVLSGVEIVLCVFAILEKIHEVCEVPDEILGGVLEQKLGIKASLDVHMAFAWLHMIFGPYIQYRLFEELKQEARTWHTVEDVADDEVDLSSTRVKGAFSDVFKYDIGVCLYVFALFGSLAWSVLLLTWADADSDCDPEGYVSRTAQTGIGFFVFVMIYSILWWCYLSCVSTMQVHGVGYMAKEVAGAAVAAKYPATAKYLKPQEASARVDTPASQHSKTKNAFGGFFGKGKNDDINRSSKQPLNAYGRPIGSSSSTGPAPNTERAPQRNASMIAAKFFASAALDAMGSASYAAPGIGEGTDIAYAPAQAIALKMLYGSNTIATVGFLEEILPGTDFIPTGLIAWGIDTFAPNNALMRSGSTESDDVTTHRPSSRR